ncbi:hypothetical protein D5086_016932 [Populus alba]|uniref:Uncharacterized protein n=1 Tax=Populus alba TaxID=43335 RepID=A0ACC4BW29_POPAL
MEKDVDKDANGSKHEPLMMTLDSPDVEEDVEENGEDYSEFQALLPPRKGGMSRSPDKVRRKVQWNDNNGNKLVEILEFEPSTISKFLSIASHKKKVANSSFLVGFDKTPFVSADSVIQCSSSVDLEIYTLVVVNHSDLVDDSTCPSHLI